MTAAITPGREELLALAERVHEAMECNGWNRHVG